MSLSDISTDLPLWAQFILALLIIAGVFYSIYKSVNYFKKSSDSSINVKNIRQENNSKSSINIGHSITKDSESNKDE